MKLKCCIIQKEGVGSIGKPTYTYLFHSRAAAILYASEHGISPNDGWEILESRTLKSVAVAKGGTV